METIIMNKITSRAIILLSFNIFLCSCDLGDTIGPARPDIKANKYLKEAGVSSETIHKIIDKKEMSREDFEKYSQSESISVRHLIASNPYTPSEYLIKLIEDDNPFVRQGVASNASISREMAETLKYDTNYSVLCSLVTNSSVQEDVIMWIYTTHKKVSLSYYAMNQKCPASIKNDILKSNDDEAKYWLDYIERGRSGASPSN